jgi:3-mercaptopyruvate sulfurtransferase SseA
MNKLFLIIVLIVAILLIASCGGTTEQATTPTTVTTATTTDIPGPPSSEELAAQDFVLPDLPRITCEQLKQKIDSGEPLVVVDTRLGLFFKGGHIPQSVNIPFQLIDEQTASLLALPKDKPIIFYCD